MLTLSSDTKKGNHYRLPAITLSPDDASSKTTLTRSDAQHLVITKITTGPGQATAPSSLL